jgi:hypothetical protein
MTSDDIETLRLELERLRAGGPERSSRRAYDDAVDALLLAWSRFVLEEFDGNDMHDAVELVRKLRSGR